MCVTPECGIGAESNHRSYIKNTIQKYEKIIDNNKKFMNIA